MIEKIEIYNKAKAFEISTSDVQRDYIFGWLLNALFTKSKYKDDLFLKGGNALRKGYFENTRYSKDLDLGIPYDISPEDLKADLDNICEYIENHVNISFIKEDNLVEEKFTALTAPLPDLKVYSVRIYFNDFYGNKSSMILKVGMDLTRFDKVLNPLQTCPLIHPYSDKIKLDCNIRCMQLEEIIATKMKCLIQRQHAPDLFDYVNSINILGGTLDTEEIVRLLIRKTIFAKNPHILKNILLNISTSYFKEYWYKSISCTKGVISDFDEAFKKFQQSIEGLFSIYPDNGYRDFTFFDVNLRIPIMEAGRTQTLLKVIYKNEERLVEPYSLQYRQREDGVAREYLYVRNVVGGASSPGIRMFVPENFQRIENTETKFIPVTQIELCKAGELPENPYLFDPNKPVKQKKTHSFKRRSINYYGIKYIYKCATCGKKFYKNNSDSTINKHKNKNGYPCFGGYGIYVGTKH